MIGSLDAAVIDKKDGKPHVAKRIDRPSVRVIPEWFGGGGRLPRKELHEAAGRLPPARQDLSRWASRRSRRRRQGAYERRQSGEAHVDATTDEITSELQEALKG